MRAATFSHDGVCWAHTQTDTYNHALSHLIEIIEHHKDYYSLLILYCLLCEETVRKKKWQSHLIDN